MKNTEQNISLEKNENLYKYETLHIFKKEDLDYVKDLLENHKDINIYWYLNQFLKNLENFLIYLNLKDVYSQDIENDKIETSKININNLDWYKSIDFLKEEDIEKSLKTSVFVALKAWSTDIWAKIYSLFLEIVSKNDLKLMSFDQDILRNNEIWKQKQSEIKKEIIEQISKILQKEPKKI